MEQLYPRLPSWLQPAAIWCYGWHLKRVRSGGVFHAAKAEFAQRDAWRAEQWREYQLVALQALLRHAVANVPYYRELHAAGRYPVEEVRSLEDVALLPCISKWDVYERPEAFLAGDVHPSALLSEKTSGTTGTPLTLYQSRETNQRWYAVNAQRLLAWNGLHEGMRHATIGARQAVSAERTRPPYWRYNPFARQLYLPVQHFTRDKLDACLDALRRYRLEYVYGYGSALDVLARHALETKREDIRLRAVFSNAEPFYPPMRARVERAFGCVTVDTYAASEKTFACFERERTLYVSPDVGVLEVIREDGSQAATGEMGEVCGTCLINPDVVLIRYRQGDRAALGETPSSGPVQMPVVEQVDGRHEDALITLDGREVRWAGIVFKTHMRILEAQVAQVAPNAVEARVVPADGYSDAVDGTLIREELMSRLGPGMHIRVRCLAEIPRLPNGKFRTVLRECEIPRPAAVPVDSPSATAATSE